MRGISLNSEGIKQLNYQVLQQNVLDEIQRPLEKMRQTDIYKPYHIVRNSKDYSNLNIFIACFTTCWARLRLYATLDMLQKCVLYTDTNSVIFSSLPHEINPPLDDFLCDFKGELGEDDFITEFASRGPKNYGYFTKKEKKNAK